MAVVGPGRQFPGRGAVEHTISEQLSYRQCGPTFNESEDAPQVKASYSAPGRANKSIPGHILHRPSVQEIENIDGGFGIRMEERSFLHHTAERVRCLGTSFGSIGRMVVHKALRPCPARAIQAVSRRNRPDRVLRTRTVHPVKADLRRISGDDVADRCFVEQQEGPTAGRFWPSVDLLRTAGR